jgi:N-formylglutamate deformylase
MNEHVAALKPANPALDPEIEALVARPLEIVPPALWTAPYVFASPHGGDVYPKSFVHSSRLDALGLRRSEDAFVAELFAAAPRHGATFIAARFPRAYIDVNRDESELDPSMFEGAPAVVPGSLSARVSAGLGVIPRVVRDGVEIYARRLPADEAKFRIEAFYRPYHLALAQLLAEAKARFGAAIVIDCHSMPPLSQGHDIVIGDRHGKACAPALADRIEQALTEAGFRVGRNAPYAGGFTTAHYGRPGENIHAVQIEIDRGLYLDEVRMEKSAGFARCRGALDKFVAQLLSRSPI